MLNQEMSNALNGQLIFEAKASMQYLAMAS